MIIGRELHWLSRHFKSYPTPLVVEIEMSDIYPSCGGYYDWPSEITGLDQTITINGKDYDGRNGIIVLVSDWTPGTLAHEYRHHLQAWKYGLWAVPSEVTIDPEITDNYYSECAFERDAILFESVVSGIDNEFTESWLRYYLEHGSQVPSRDNFIGYV